jgi:hypothetical protein
MVKKIIEDVVITKKSSPTILRSISNNEHRKGVEVEKVLEPSAKKEGMFTQKNEFRKETNHIEEILPKTETKEEETKEKDIEQSPIFEKMKQRHEERESFSQEYAADKEGKFGKYLIKIGIILGAVVIIGLVLWSTVFYSASVVIHLKHAKVALVNQDFEAVADTPDSVPFQIMSLSAEDTVKLTPTGEQRVTKKASGQIVIYNNFSTGSQVLIKNTRFETPDGKIFRIDSGTTVPGIKKVDGKNIPGSVTVTVYADEAGTEYNIGLVDFTIPGFKGSPRYDKFYGRSKTVMSGGASGMVKTISDTDRETAKENLTKSLTEKLLTLVKAQKPNGTVIYPEAMFFTFIDTVNDNAEASEKDVPFTLQGKLDVVLFNENSLSQKIVKTTVNLTENEKIKIDNIESLKFAWKNSTSGVPQKTDTLDFQLSGSANAVWGIDINAFKNKLAGKSVAEYNAVSVQFLGIEKTSDKKFSPPWRKVFPLNIEKIDVETIID